MSRRTPLDLPPESPLLLIVFSRVPAAATAVLQGVVPLGGSKVETIERGPKGNKFGIKVTHPDFSAGRALILAAESADAQKSWLTTLQDCSRV